MPSQTAPSTSLEQSSVLSSPRKLFIGLIVIAWAVIYLTSLFQPPLQDDADTVHAEAAREMAFSGDWVTLHINGGDGAKGLKYLEKSPLMFWCIAASFKVFGVSEWPARLPIVLGVLALLLVTYRLGRRVYGNEEGGFYSALALATGFGPFIFTRILIPDMAVALWLALGFDFFLTALEQIEAGQKTSRWLCWGIAATMALNVLSKGLIGLVFPVGTILIFLLLTGRLRYMLKLHLLSSFLVFLLIGAPWHILAVLRNPAQGKAPGFFWWYFVNEHFLRYLNKRFPADYDTFPLWLFWGLMLVWLMPWTAFLPQALAQIPGRWREWRSGLSGQQQGTLLFAIWMFLVLVFFSFSSRQEYYVIAGIPGLALLLGGWLAKETSSSLDSRERRAGRISSAVLMIIGIAACLFAILLAMEARTPPANYDIADLLKKNPQAYKLSLGHFLDLTPQAMGAFKIPLLITGIALGLGTIINWLLRRTNRTFAANLVLGAMMVIVLHEAQSGLIIFSPVLTSKVLADSIQANWKLGDMIETNGDYETASSVNFYTHHQIRMLNGRCNNIWYGSELPGTPGIFDDNKSFERLWHSEHRIFLLTDEQAIPKSGEDNGCPQTTRLPSYIDLNDVCRLAKWGGKVVLTNESKPCPVRVPSAR